MESLTIMAFDHFGSSIDWGSWNPFSDVETDCLLTHSDQGRAKEGGDQRPASRVQGGAGGRQRAQQPRARDRRGDRREEVPLALQRQGLRPRRSQLAPAGTLAQPGASSTTSVTSFELVKEQKLSEDDVEMANQEAQEMRAREAAVAAAPSAAVADVVMDLSNALGGPRSPTRF